MTGTLLSPNAQAHRSETSPLRAGATVDVRDASQVHLRMVLDGCKWDPQVEDVATLSSFPLLIGRRSWDELTRLAEQLSSELSQIEQMLPDRPDLHSRLAVPRRLRGLLAQPRDAIASPTAVRAVRFDFHWTTGGWQISEVNSDVPGGFSEASEFTRLMSQVVPGTSVPGDPAGAWTDAIAGTAHGKSLALMCAPGFMEDQQVIAYLSRRLRQRGMQAHLVTPDQISWRDGAAMIASCAGNIEAGAIVRFYQAEWVVGLPTRLWVPLFVGGKTPITNPAVAALTESKRLPLIWNELGADVPTWRRLLPETVDPREAPWRRDDRWLLKTAYCNTGDTVTAQNLSTPRQWLAAAWSVRMSPRQWIAQRRFEPLPVSTPMGDVYPCVGVFTINGRAAGAYTRISHRPIIDYRAIDVPLLIREEL